MFSTLCPGAGWIIIECMKNHSLPDHAMTLRPLRTIRPALTLIAALALVLEPAHATSFDCSKGRSLTEKMICHDPVLSKLDDTLGRLYWKARRQQMHPSERRAFIADSDSKWAWREAHCLDMSCVGAWYAARIGELKHQLDATGTETPGATPRTPGMPLPLVPRSPRGPSDPPTRTAPPLPASTQTEIATLQCTAAEPGIVMNQPCPAVLRETGGQWRHATRDADWFCGVATLTPPSLSVAAQPEGAQ
ncbi:hypothetical protein AAGS40_09230 [Paraburkholderia sp. PREW-6R]|uniref:lysozyme inhibitor LprI family protein n=1 Tax=Paraburkholderia sp. PREW-6R TaxID=3141544 RepID=UPI0031F5C18F